MGRGGHRVFLQVPLEGGHRADDRLGVLADPTIRDEADRNGIEVVALLAPDAAGRDQFRALEDVQVAHDAEPGHIGQVAAQVAERSAVLVEQEIEQEPAARVGQGAEDGFHSGGDR